jgi:hypothetical protein
MSNKLSLSKGAIFLLVSAFIISSFCTPKQLLAGETSGLLDGRSFVGKTGEVGKESAEDEEIVFRDGKLHSVGCEPWNFNDGEYKAMRSGEGDKIHFEAETESPKHGKIVWKGTVEGDSIDVNYTWSKKGWLGTKTKDKWFKGTLKK